MFLEYKELVEGEVPSLAIWNRRNNIRKYKYLKRILFRILVYKLCGVDSEYAGAWCGEHREQNGPDHVLVDARDQNDDGDGDHDRAHDYDHGGDDHAHDDDGRPHIYDHAHVRGDGDRPHICGHVRGHDRICGHVRGHAHICDHVRDHGHHKVRDDDDRDHDDDDHRYIYDHGRAHDRGHMVHDRHLTHNDDGGDVYSFCIFSYVYDHIHGDDDRNRGYCCNQHYYRNRHLNRTGYWVVSNEHLFPLHLDYHLLKDHYKSCNLEAQRYQER